MIKSLDRSIKSYERELSKLNETEIYQREYNSFCFNGEHLHEIPGMINEKIKISDTFTHYIIERCDPRHVSSLRRFVEEYEERVSYLAETRSEDVDTYGLKETTVAINLLFDMDISYYSVLVQMMYESKLERVRDYFKENIGQGLTYEGLCNAINRKGYGI